MSAPLNTAWPEFDDFAREEMRYKARGAIKRGTEVYGQASDEWVANRVRMLARTDLAFEAICSAGRDRVMRLSMEVAELRGILTARRADETSVALTECPYCKRPAAHDESIYHAAGCAGMERMFITRLEYDRVRGGQKTKGVGS